MSEQAGLHGSKLEELLLIASREQASDLAKQIASTYTVTQIASPRVLVVKAEPGAAERLSSISGLTVIRPGEATPEAVEGLDDVERLFIAAWTGNRNLQSKKRSGEGLPWDAPGFVPPDPPRR